MAADGTLKAHFPVAWQGLYSALSAHDNQLVTMETWLNKVRHSHHGHRLSWDQLIGCLVAEEPVKVNKKMRSNTNSSCLQFAPVFGHLPALAQNYMLCFLYQHREEIRTASLDTLLEILHTSDKNANTTDLNTTLPHTDWQPYWAQKFSNYVNNKLPVGTSTRNASDSAYLFTSVGSEWKDKIVARLKCQNPEKESNHGYRGSPWQQALWSDNTETVHPPVKSSSQTEHDPEGCHGDASVWSQDADSDMDTTDCFLSQATQADSEHTAKRRKIDELNRDLLSESGLEDQLGARLQRCGSALREAWHRVPPEEVCAGDLDTLTSCTQDQMWLLARYARLSSVPEPNLLSVAGQIGVLRETLALSHAATLTRECLLEKLQSLDGACPRALHTACVTLTQAYPAAVIANVLVPILASSHVGSHQCDLVMRLVREPSLHEHNHQLLREYLECQATFTAAVLPVIQAIIDAKTSIDSSTLDLLTKATAGSAQQLADNLKFGKVFLGLVKGYGSQLDQSQTRTLLDAADSHKTFLKKSILAAVKKAK